MTAKDVISRVSNPDHLLPMKTVDQQMPLLEVLPHLLDAPGRLLGVVSMDGRQIGVIDQTSLLEGLGRMIVARDDSSVVTIECDPQEYSASLLAHAVEDADAHLVDLFSAPGEGGRLRVTLRVRSLDPTAAIHSLERYGYSVVESGNGDAEIDDTLAERLASLQALINV